jgi:serine/threonine protein kinase
MPRDEMDSGSVRLKDADDFARVACRSGMVGWIRKDWTESFGDFIRDADGFFNDPTACVLKDASKTKVIQTTLRARDGAARKVIFKRFRYRGPVRRLGFLWLDSPARRSLRGALLLGRRGFDTATPLAVFEFRNWKDLGTSYYITEEIQDTRCVLDLWRFALSSLASSRRIALARSIISDLARLICRLHGTGIYHADLKGTNILVREWDTERRRFFLIDLDRVEEKRHVSLAKRLKNLVQLRVSWKPKERIHFFIRYAELCGASRSEAKALARRALALRQKHLRRRAKA